MRVFEVFVRSKFRIIEISRKKITPRLAYTDDIDLCCGNAVREFKNFVASPLACNLARAVSDFCPKNGGNRSTASRAFSNSLVISIG
jgi:hypothetical protein